MLITLFRGGHVSAGRSWPLLTSGRLATAAGWRAVLTRSAYPSCTLGLLTYGGVTAQVVGGSFVWNVLAVLVIGTAALVSLPYLSAGSTRMRIAWLCYYALGLAFAVVVPFALASELPDPTAMAALLVVVVMAGLEVGPLLDAVRSS